MKPEIEASMDRQIGRVSSLSCLRSLAQNWVV